MAVLNLAEEENDLMDDRHPMFKLDLAIEPEPELEPEPEPEAVVALPCDMQISLL